MEVINISDFLEIKITDDGEFIQCPKGDAARIIPPVITIIHENGKKESFLMFVEEDRVPVGKKIYNFPGGRLEKGENALKSAVRELFEETGLSIDIESVVKLTDSKFKDADNSIEKEALFLCDQEIIFDAREDDISAIEESISKNQKLDENENCKVKLVSFDDLEEFLKHTDMCLPTRLALYQFMAGKLGLNPADKSLIEIDNNVSPKKKQEYFRVKNFVVNGVDRGKYSYFYYAVDYKKLAFMTEINVEGKTFRLYEKQKNKENTEDYILSHPSSKQKYYSKDILSVIEELFGEEIKNKINEVKVMTPFDVVSPGITDLRESLNYVSINLTKEEFEEFLTKNEGKYFAYAKEEIKDIEGKFDYITQLSEDYQRIVQKNIAKNLEEKERIVK